MVIDEQYRVYRLTALGHLELIATCGTKEAVGTALVTLSEEDEFEGCTVGVMYRPHEDKPGRWLVSPFHPRIPRSGDGGKVGKRRRLKGKHSNKERS